MEFNFQRLGQGFSPVTEKVYCFNPLKESDDFNTVTVGKKQFKVPHFVKVVGGGNASNTTSFKSRSFVEKHEYQEYMQSMYQIEAGCKLVVQASSKGRWVDDNDSSNESSILHFCLEHEICRMSINNVRDIKFREKFQEELDVLPDEYNNKTRKVFEQFISRCGSHIIVEQAIGGTLDWKCHVTSRSFSHARLTDIQAAAKNVVESIIGTTSPSAETSQKAKKFTEIGISKENFTVTGGNFSELPPSLQKLTPDLYQKWIQTVAYNPKETEAVMKLEPYCNLLPNSNKSRALAEAIADYMAQTDSTNMPITRQITAVNEGLHQRQKSRRDIGMKVVRDISQTKMDPPVKNKDGVCDCNCAIL